MQMLYLFPYSWGRLKPSAFDMMLLLPPLNALFCTAVTGDASLILLCSVDTPSQRVRFILGTEEDEEHVPHDLFTELDEICVKEGEDTEWKETAR